MKKLIVFLFLLYCGFCFGQSHQDSLKSSDYVLSLAQGDSCFLAKNYSMATEFFTHASEIKPNEIYPQSRLLECNKMILLNSKYEYNILKGDQCGLNKQYKEAKAFYQEALNLKPTEQYPKEKIKEMNNLINPSKNK